MSAAVKPNLHMTAGDYLAWEREQVERSDFLHGEVFAIAGGTPRHSALGAAIIGELSNAFRGGPCRTLTSDQRVAVRDGEHYVYPDVSVVCGPMELARGTRDTVANPTILVEVLSKRTEAYDRGRKWEGYQRLASLTDYLLVNQTAPRIEHFQRDANGAWRYREVQAGGRVTLSNGATIAVDAVYQGVFELEGESVEPDASSDPSRA